MKILLSSHFFLPQVGGIEVMSSTLAEEFADLGHSVKVVTQTLEEDGAKFPYEVVRQPSAKKLFQLVKWCDVYFHNNISLQMAWPLLLMRKPWVIAHHTWISRPDGSRGAQDYLKRFLLRFGTNICISQAMAKDIRVPSVVIGNCYRDAFFCRMDGVERNKELVYLGRLVSDKGVDILLQAIGRLKQQGLCPHLTIIGSGPEQSKLQEISEELGIGTQVNFVGSKNGHELVQLLNQHHIMVIPSRWKEPFGIVALEGIACGCVIVGSEGGGIKDAIGPCGITFPNGDTLALTEKLALLLSDMSRVDIYRQNATSHLDNHKVRIVAQRYLDVLHNVKNNGA